MVKHILIVDDEESTAFFLGENLADLGPGYQVETALSGEEAIYKIAVQSFDLVITDLRMPGLNGLELIKWIRKASPETRLVLMTAYGSAEVERQAHSLEVSRYMTKPFRIEDLLDAVRGALGGASLSRQGVLVLADNAFEEVTACLDQLRAEIDAQCIMLADLAGQLITHSGSPGHLEMDTLASLIGGGFATTFELARRLGQERAFNLNYQEGTHYDVYTANVGEGLFLIILYSKAVRTSRIGLVWMYTRRAINDLLTTVANARPGATDDLVGDDFGDLLQQEMDSAFGDDLFGLTAQLESAAALPQAQPAAPAAESGPAGADIPASALAAGRPTLPARTPQRVAAPAERPNPQRRQPPAQTLPFPQPPVPEELPPAPDRAGPPQQLLSSQSATAPHFHDKERATFSLEEARRMGLIDDELFEQLRGRRNRDYASPEA